MVSFASIGEVGAGKPRILWQQRCDMMHAMRETIRIEQIKCERCVARLADALAPLKGINEARIEYGNSALVVDYDDEQQAALDAAITGASFRIVERTPEPAAS